MAGAPYPRAVRPALADTPGERRKVYDQYYNGGGFRMLASTYFDLIFNPVANETAAEYIRERIRERVKDPEVAELLCPTDHPYGTKRATFESNYYETFNLPHVHLVDARTTPITAITENGIATTAREYEFDVIVLATGFDVGGAVVAQMGVVGRGGRKLTEHWAHGQRAYLGMATRGFPNLFHINGPQGPAAMFNNGSGCFVRGGGGPAGSGLRSRGRPVRGSATTDAPLRPPRQVRPPPGRPCCAAGAPAPATWGHWRAR